METDEIVYNKRIIFKNGFLSLAYLPSKNHQKIGKESEKKVKKKLGKKIGKKSEKYSKKKNRKKSQKSSGKKIKGKI